MEDAYGIKALVVNCRPQASFIYKNEQQYLFKMKANMTSMCT